MVKNRFLDESEKGKKFLFLRSLLVLLINIFFQRGKISKPNLLHQCSKTYIARKSENQIISSSRYAVEATQDLVEL